MKKILLIGAAAGITAAGVYSYTQTAGLKALVEETNAFKKEMRLSDNERADAKKQLEEMRLKLAKVKAEYNEFMALLDDLKTKSSGVAAPKSLTLKVERQDEQIKKYEAEIAENVEAFEKVSVEISEAENYLSTTEAKVKTLEASREEVAVALEEAQVVLDETTKKFNELTEKDRQRNASLSQNSISSLITAVDGDWGFVVIKKHPRAEISESSSLIVVRGAEPLGRLSVESVERGRILANVIMSSMPAGARIRPGDRVILAEPNRF